MSQKMFEIVTTYHDSGIVKPFTLYTIYERNDIGVFARFITKDVHAALRRLKEFEGEHNANRRCAFT